MSSSNQTQASVVEKFLRLFYIVLPSRTTFTSLDDIPDYITEAIPYFVMTIGFELVFYAFKGGLGWSTQKMRLNDVVTSIGSGSLMQLTRFFVRSMEMTSYIYVSPSPSRTQSGRDTIVNRS